MKPVVLALCGVLLAPYQCATAEHKPLEDTAPKSLWLLAERFEKEGQSSAREVTLKQLVEQYPGSRYARKARAELGMADPLDDTVSEATLADDAQRAERGEEPASETARAPARQDDESTESPEEGAARE